MVNLTKQYILRCASENILLGLKEIKPFSLTTRSRGSGCLAIEATLKHMLNTRHTLAMVHAVVCCLGSHVLQTLFNRLIRNT